ncbi:amidohydrolase [Streptomyces sp. V4-01]|uniref:Amidohydrolase n=1 Tax=Actinacidiphila polyblastidii TaxID=3110430 RepID=A0ABU7P6N4_9ACTN|nr:amidohydrolase [Streptomyces sp. V4-01]
MAGAQGHLVDAYCHGVLQGDLGLGAFEARLPGAAAPGTTLFDSPTGFALRRWCPPLLGLEPHCPPARYLARRRQLGAYETARRLLRGTGITGYLVDSAEPGDLTAPKELGAAGAAPAYEVVRLEPLAQQVADTSGTVDCFLANLAESVHGAAQEAVGFACGDGTAPAGGGRHARRGAERLGRPYGEQAAAGRHAGPWPPGDTAGDPAPGPADGGCDLRPPSPPEVRRAAARWLADRRIGSRPTDPVLLRHLRWHAVAAGLPLVLRYGPAGSGPRGAESFLRATAGLGVEIVLLPGPAHEPAAADLAAALPHVYVALGGDPAAVLARTPFGKVLFASGAVGLPELYVTGARQFLAGLRRTVGERVAAGEWSQADGERVAALVGEGNARRVHRLPATAAGRLPHPRPVW